MGFICESSKDFRVYIPTKRKVVVSLDVIIGETRGYEGEISNTNEIDLLLDCQIDPFVDQAPAHANIRTTENDDETKTEGDDQVNPHAGDEFLITDAQTDYILYNKANTKIEVDEQHTPNTEGNETRMTGREHIENK